MKKMRRLVFALSTAVFFCFMFTPLSQAGPGGDPGPAPPPEPQGQGGSYPPGVLKNLEPVQTTPVWQITANGTALSVIWTDHEPNPRFAIYDYDGDNDDITIPAEEAFCDDVVLDKETGLVWERCPGTDSDKAWTHAINHCRKMIKAKRQGYRLPTLEELQTLFYPVGNTEEVALPAGHPFIGVEPSQSYWTTTTNPCPTCLGPSALLMRFIHTEALAGNIVSGEKSNSSLTNCVWCVRGGIGHDTYLEE